jgi:arginyl-tRNA synthetase
MSDYRDYNLAITVIDNRQLPAQQVVHGALQLLGYLSDDKRYEPLGYGVLYLTPSTLLQMGCVLTPEEINQTRLPFASRKGRSMSVDDLLDLLHTKVFDASRARHPDLDESVLHHIAEAVAVSSLRFLLTKTDVSKDMTFDLDECLDLE